MAPSKDLQRARTKNCLALFCVSASSARAAALASDDCGKMSKRFVFTKIFLPAAKQRASATKTAACKASHASGAGFFLRQEKRFAFIL